jgi:hypothetical protein
MNILDVLNITLRFSDYFEKFVAHINKRASRTTCRQRIGRGRIKINTKAKERRVA